MTDFERIPVIDQTASPFSRRKAPSPSTADPSAKVAFQQPQSNDAALQSPVKPDNVPTKTQAVSTAKGPSKQRPVVKVAEMRATPEDGPPVLPKSQARVAPSVPTLPRVKDEMSQAPAAPSNARAVPLTDMNDALRPKLDQLSQNVPASASIDLQVQPQVMTMPTTLISRAGESLSATRPAKAPPENDVSQAPQSTEQAEPPASRVILAGATQPQANGPSATAAVGQLNIAPKDLAQPLASPEQLVERAATESEQQDFDRSLASYDQALEQSPSYMPALMGRSKLYRQLSRFDESLTDCAKLIRIYPENAEGFLERGRTRFAMGLVPEAVDDFDKAVKFDANNAMTRLERGKAHLMMRDFAAALADYNDALRLAPGMTRGYIERARVQRLLHQPDDALDDYTAAIQLEGQAVDGLLERALLYLELDKVQKSLADLNAAIDRAPGDARIYVARARLYRHERAWREAQDDLDAAERLDPLSKPLQLEREALQDEMPKGARASAAGS